MKKLALLILFIPSFALAEGPLFKHKDPEKQQEFENVYKDIRSKASGQGTVAGDNACPTCIGFYYSTFAVVSVLVPASNSWDDILSTTVAAGDWWVGGGARFDSNTATWTGCSIAVSTVAGNSSSTITPSISNTQATWASSSTTPLDMTLNTPVWRWSSSTPTTIYLKRQATYTVNTPRTREQNLWVRRAR